MKPTVVRTMTGAILLGAGFWAASALAPSTRDVPSLQQADALFSTGDSVQAIQAYDKFIEANDDRSEPEVQDEVAAAKIRKGFALGKLNQFSAARATFLEASRTYRGTGKQYFDEGGAVDHALYQAAVCLQALGDLKAAKSELREFIAKYPDSPKVSGAFKRLSALSQGKELDDVVAMINAAEHKRTHRQLLEMAKCGPRAVQHLAHLLGKTVPPENQLVAACSTGVSGTSMQGVLNGLRACGLGGFAYELNREDFQRAPLPAIWLKGNHYLVLRSINPSGRMVTVYDPLTGKDEVVRLPADTTGSFRAYLITLEPIDLTYKNPS